MQVAREYKDIMTFIAHAHQPTPDELHAEPLTFFSAGGWFVVVFTILAIALLAYRKYIFDETKKKKHRKKKPLPPLIYRGDFVPAAKTAIQRALDYGKRKLGKTSKKRNKKT